MASIQTRVRAPIVIPPKPRVRTPAHQDELPLSIAKVEYMNGGKPMLMDIVQSKYGDSFIVLCLARLDTFHYLHNENAPAIGVLTVEMWAAIQHAVRRASDESKPDCQYAYKNRSGHWEYRFPLFVNYQPVTTFSLKTRNSPSAPKQPVCSSPIAKPLVSPSPIPPRQRVRSSTP